MNKEKQQILKEKLGLLPLSVSKIEGTPRIWVNAVSVGEVVAAGSIVKLLRETYPSASIILSTGTETGRKTAEQTIKEVDGYIYFPLDFPWVVRRVLRILRPHLFITIETEIWPNFLSIARKMGIKTMLANGRISARSFNRYRRTRFLWKKVLGNFDAMSMISKIDAERIKSIGAEPEKVFISGNSKYDTLISRANPGFKAEIRKLLQIEPYEAVFLAASTHDGEEKIIIKAYKNLLKEFPHLIFIIAPRHIKRVASVEKALRSEGLSDFIHRSSLQHTRRKSPIIILDVIGELFYVYSLGTIIFCGGSLVKKGGQNILEPACWGKVVFYGPSMEDFLVERELLGGAGAGIEVKGAASLVREAMVLLNNPEERRQRGEKGREAIQKMEDAAKKNVRLAQKLLKDF
ncbi:3-deoxy-D-manno-octulosonic acid transferase [candidate division NPL-UPA2 bacterium Unc8]|uniref:3-deoxy-D-manno-octulosonic acid transferase n=1 Tax=candidate division NPL-UPA2 bacterium Unc8 TaxID=1980939 RepID=A0A399FYE1_UNCN2|nr:3-deoxy-D-manno-octulosonic acid transferase [Bacillota bacterium]RII00390.1 MAG: 3-deoxy-D-manno-octulosonic acid transferase [candidate division NPL-UPA2 bacterium Unc8]